MRIIRENNIFEEKVKNSLFIANTFYVETKEDVIKYLQEVNKKYNDAKHNCYAYKIGDIMKMSDDGEPSKTAGFQILNAIKENDLDNILIVVTRYFGGILLGTGLLSKTYKNMAKKVIEGSNILEVEYGILVKSLISYENIKIYENYLKNNNIHIVSTKYLENVEYLIEMPEYKKEEYVLFLEDMIGKKIETKGNDDLFNYICEKIILKR